jgi:UDP-N-acetylglucosamine 2-epimerase (non-hydrolysing)
MARPRRIVSIAGARPNFMKIAPIVAALRRRPETFESVLVHTGQHYDEQMSQVFFDELGIPRPDINLNVGSGSHAQQTAAIMVGFEQILTSQSIDLVLVVGDVNSTIACALVASKLGVPVAHVEAGLRSYDRRMPEEINRVLTDQISDLLFTTEESAADNLRREGVDAAKVHFVGNVMIDTLLAARERAMKSDILTRLGLAEGGYGLVTLHRPANVDEPGMLKSLIEALGQIAVDCPLVLPAHPRAAPHLAALGVPAGVRVIDPLGYLDFVAAQAGARLVLTDSGGVQEETTALGVPCLTLRDTTERPITITEGTNVLVGRDPVRIVEEARRVLRDGVSPRRPALWDGRAGERIADVLLDESRPRR